ncbi:MAG: SMP-30/gluconolactonase/LRE family protein [Fimbriimonadaceae bacterium]
MLSALLLATTPAMPQDFTLADFVSPDAKVAQVATGFRFTEGPVWTPKGLIFSDIPASKLYLINAEGVVSTYRDPSHEANGNVLDAQGRLLTCEHATHRVVREEEGGKITVIAETYEGKRLCAPNDLAVHRDGAVYFTDPFFGRNPESLPLDFRGVYRVVPGGSPVLLTKEIELPNGIAFSPDSKTLYVSDSRTAGLFAFPVLDNGLIGPQKWRVNFERDKPGAADGMAVHPTGVIFCTGPGGVILVSPDGKIIGRIDTPETSTNCCFGGADGKTLYITANTSVYSIRVNR